MLGGSIVPTFWITLPQNVQMCRRYTFWGILRQRLPRATRRFRSRRSCITDCAPLHPTASHNTVLGREGWGLGGVVD